MSPSTRGRFITFEGGEGAGKSVQAKRLEEKLKSLSVEVVRTREPGGSPQAEALRDAILSGFAAQFGPEGEALLFGRFAGLTNVGLLPALARGAWVVCDRFADSTRAYQGVAGNLPPDYVARLEQVVVGPNRPDLTLVLDIPAETGLKRAAKRRGKGGADRFEAEALAFHQTLRRAFLDIAAAEPQRCAVIDALKSPKDVAAAIWAVVEARLDSTSAPKRDPQ